MNNKYLMLITILMFYITFFICYQLALTFIGVSLPVKQILLPVLIFSIIGYISKISLGASASIQTVVVAITCAGLLYLLNKINFLFSLIGSLLGIITLTLGSMIVACPLFVKLGYAIPLKFNGLEWLFLALLELVIPVLVLVVLKTSKFSLMKYIPITQ
jgi:hypothetical protein